MNIFLLLSSLCLFFRLVCSLYYFSFSLSFIISLSFSHTSLSYRYISIICILYPVSFSDRLRNMFIRHKCVFFPTHVMCMRARGVFVCLCSYINASYGNQWKHSRKCSQTRVGSSRQRRRHFEYEFKVYGETGKPITVCVYVFIVSANFIRAFITSSKDEHHSRFLSLFSALAALRTC